MDRNKLWILVQKHEGKKYNEDSKIRRQNHGRVQLLGLDYLVQANWVPVHFGPNLIFVYSQTYIDCGCGTSPDFVHVFTSEVSKLVLIYCQQSFELLVPVFCRVAMKILANQKQRMHRVMCRASAAMDKPQSFSSTDICPR